MTDLIGAMSAYAVRHYAAPLAIYPATPTAHALLVGNGSSAINFLAPGTAGNVVSSDGTDWATVLSTSVNTASTLVKRDANVNFQTNVVQQGVDLIDQTGGPVVVNLTVTSGHLQHATGTSTSNTVTINLPDARTLKVGHEFLIWNESQGIYNLNDGAGVAIRTGGFAESFWVILLDNSTLAGNWGKIHVQGSGAFVLSVLPTIGAVDSTTNAVTTAMNIRHQTFPLLTPANNIGVDVWFNISSNGGGLTQAGRIGYIFPNAAIGSLTSRAFLSAMDSSFTERIAIGWGANGSAPQFGVLGKATTPAVAVTQGATLTNNVTSGGTNNTIANYTDLTVYANDAAAIRNDIYQLARISKIMLDALRTFGFLT